MCSKPTITQGYFPTGQIGCVGNSHVIRLAYTKILTPKVNLSLLYNVQSSTKARKDLRVKPDIMEAAMFVHMSVRVRPKMGVGVGTLIQQHLCATEKN